MMLPLVILLVSAAAVAMLVFAGPLTATTFGYGAFQARDVQMATLPAFMRHTYRTPSQQVSFLCRPH